MTFRKHQGHQSKKEQDLSVIVRVVTCTPKFDADQKINL